MELFKKNQTEILGYIKRDGQDFVEALDLRNYIDRVVEMKCAEIAAALARNGPPRGA